MSLSHIYKWIRIWLKTETRLVAKMEVETTPRVSASWVSSSISPPVHPMEPLSVLPKRIESAPRFDAISFPLLSFDEKRALDSSQFRVDSINILYAVIGYYSKEYVVWVDSVCLFDEIRRKLFDVSEHTKDGTTIVSLFRGLSLVQSSRIILLALACFTLMMKFHDDWVYGFGDLIKIMNKRFQRLFTEQQLFDAETCVMKLIGYNLCRPNNLLRAIRTHPMYEHVEVQNDENSQMEEEHPKERIRRRLLFYLPWLIVHRECPLFSTEQIVQALSDYFTQPHLKTLIEQAQHHEDPQVTLPFPPCLAWVIKFMEANTVDDLLAKHEEMMFESFIQIACVSPSASIVPWQDPLIGSQSFEQVKKKWMANYSL